MAGALTPLDQVQEAVLAGRAPLPAVVAALADALGCVAAADVVAAVQVPPFANSAMDGFAVRAADTAGASGGDPARLAVVATATAGHPAPIEVGPGQAIRIMTGAPVPAGADAVAMVEVTRPAAGGGSGDGVEVLAPARPGDHVRPAGDDVAVGDVVVAAGTELRPAHLGLLAGVGVGELAVVPRPRVGVLSTGDEVVAAAGPRPEPGALAPGAIYDANRPLLAALVARAGGVAVDLGSVPDDEGALADALVAAADRCDLVLTSGGVSVGDHDHLADVLAGVGEARTFRIAIKPAKPFVLGRVGGVPVLALPGNPVSSLVSFELLARPALRALRGVAPARPDPVRGRLAAPVGRRADGKVHYVRVATTPGADGVTEATPVGHQGSHHLQAAAAATALAVVPDGTGLPAGGPVDLLPLL